MPDNLTPEAYAELDRITADLASMEVLTTVDRAALTLYIENWQIKRDAWDGYRKTALIIKGSNGQPQATPYVKHRRGRAHAPRRVRPDAEFAESPDGLDADRPTTPTTS